jgi:hypothetical protein
MLYTQRTKINEAFNVDCVLTSIYRANKSHTTDSGYKNVVILSYDNTRSLTF